MKETRPTNTNFDTPQVDPIVEPTNVHSASPNYFPQKTHKNKFSFLLILFVLVTGAIIGITSIKSPQDIRNRAAATGTKLAISPATKTVVIGETITLGITMNTNTDTVSAAELHLTYDPTAIQILSFTPGAVLPVILTPEKHTNGAISVTLGTQPSSPFKGADIVGTWTIKILVAKQSSLSFASSTQVAAIGKTTNALVSSTGSSITGTTGTANTPTPTKTPTPTSPPQNTPSSTPTSIPSASPTATPTPTPTSPPQNTPSSTPTSIPSASPTANPTIPKTGFGIFVDETMPTPTTDMLETEPIAETPVSEIPTDQPVPEQTPSPTIIEQFIAAIISFFKNIFGK